MQIKCVLTVAENLDFKCFEAKNLDFKLNK